MRSSRDLTRRRALLLLAGVAAIPTAAQSSIAIPNPAELIVMADGWVLRASDLDKAAADVA